MPFNICPFNNYVQKKILPFAGERGVRERVPLTARAEEAFRNRSITISRATELSDHSRFTLGERRFTVMNCSKKNPRRLLALLISHLGSIFDEGKIRIRIADESPSAFIIDLEAFDPDNQRTLALKFSVHYNNYLELKRLYSSRSGLGGKTVAASYNLAKALGVAEIFYTPTDAAAKAFYFHMDFVSRITGSIFWLRV